MNKQIRDAISRFGEEACLMAYEFNVNQGEGGAFIETNTGIPKRSQGAAIAAGEYLSKRGKMNPVKSRKENYNDFNEWETDAFRAGATQVVRLGENLFSAIKMKDGSLAKLDKDGFVDMRSRTGQMVRSNSTTVGSWYGERGEINRQLVAKSGKSRPYENPKESPLYVKYLSLMRGEEPFMMGGTKYEYVWAEYPGGIKDIGVYSYAGDLVYSYDSFRKMMNLDRTNPIHSRNPKHRIGISLSKNRRRNPLESGATISDDEDINDRASNMG